MQKIKKRVNVYIDGFNLYYGLLEAEKNKNWQNLLWLNLWGLANSIAFQYGKLQSVKYFTSDVTHPPEKLKRQRIFLRAIKTGGNIDIIKGNFERNQKKCDDCADKLICNNCKRRQYKIVEKKTDVNIANEMLKDAFLNRCDVLVLLSGDSDLISPIECIHKHTTHKIISSYLPTRKSDAIIDVADNSFKLTEKFVKKQLFPDRIQISPKKYIDRPDFGEDKFKPNEVTRMIKILKIMCDSLYKLFS